MAETFCDNPHCRYHVELDREEHLRRLREKATHQTRRRLYREHATGPERHYCEECYKALLDGGLTPD